MSLSPDLGDWNPRDSLAETLSLTGENEIARDSLSTGSLAVSARSKGEFQDTARTWQTGSRPQHRRRALAVLGGVVLVAGLAWFAPWKVEQRAPALALPTAPPTEAPLVPAARASETPDPSPEKPPAVTSANSAAPLPKVRLRPPKPAPVSSAAPPNPFNAPLDDRK